MYVFYANIYREEFGPLVIAGHLKPIAISPSTYSSCSLTIALYLLLIGYYNSCLLRTAFTHMHTDHH